MRSAKPKAARRRHSSGKAAEARRESVRARSDVAERHPAPEAVETAGSMAEATISEAACAADETSEQARSSIDAWAESGAVVTKGMEDIGRAWMRFTQRTLEDGVAAANAILKARSLPEAVGLQSEYARNSFGNLVAEGMRVSELSVRVAQDAMRPIRARLDTAAGQRS